MNTTPDIVTEGLTRSFGSTIAVNKLSITINRGEIFGLLGHNGAGKTTTVRLLNGILTPTAGSARVLGLDPMQQGSQLRRRTGVLTETPSLYETLSARDNLRIFADLYDVPLANVDARIDAMLDLFSLGDRAAEKVGGYSKGMKQRLALARAFLHQPDVLFLDEPTAGLDPVAAKSVNDVIQHLSRVEGKTIVLATHYLYDAQRLCDRVAILRHGSVVAMGALAELSRQFNHTFVLSIDVAHKDLDRASAALRTIGGQPSVNEFTLTVTGFGYEQIPHAVETLVQAGVRVYGVRQNEPTLEDIYFAIEQGIDQKNEVSA